MSFALTVVLVDVLVLRFGIPVLPNTTVPQYQYVLLVKRRTPSAPPRSCRDLHAPPVE